MRKKTQKDRPDFQRKLENQKGFVFERDIFLVSLIKDKHHSKIYIIIMDNGKNSLRIKGNL